MERNRMFALIAIVLLLFSTTSFWAFPSVSAAATHQIFLPFHTGWENGQPLGRTNAVDYKKDFYGYYGPSDPLVPELGWRYNEVGPPPDVFAYEFGSRQLMTTGYFGSSYSYSYFNLFDTTSDSDWGPPFKIKQHTFINIWYYHYQLGDCMIDAQIYNPRTKQYWTLRDFNYDGEYIVDQNGVRIHPAHRYNDPIGSWQFASFDLSVIYESDPENWYFTKIWIGFDNGIDGAQGPARTYFDLLHISYGTGDKITNVVDEPYLHDNAWVSGSIEAWGYWLRPDGYYNLYLKVGVSGFNDGYWVNELGWPLNLYPYTLKVSTDAPDAMVLTSPEPTGVNLTEPDSAVPPPEAGEWVLDVLTLLAEMAYAPNPYLLSGLMLAQTFFGLLKVPEEEPTYEWPEADWGPVGVGGYILDADWDPKNVIAGEVFIEIPGLSPGSHSFSFTFTVGFYYKNPNPMPPGTVWATGYGSLSLPLTIEWSTEPDNIPPETPSTPSGRSYGYTMRTYEFSTSTTDFEGDLIQYQFWWDDTTTTTTGWYPSGETATASHSWDYLGTYWVKVRARDSYHGWGDWSPPHKLEIIAGGGGSCPFIYSWDGQQYRFDHEAYPFAVMKSVETTSYDRLKYLKEVDGEYRLRIEQVLYEITWLDSFDLYVVDHPDNDSFVMPDLEGNLHTVKELIQPISAYEKNGDDRLEDVKYLDYRIWQDSVLDANVSDESTLRNWITLTFPKPEATTAKLLLNIKKQETITTEWEFFINAIGENYWKDWQKIMEDPLYTQLFLDMLEREINLRIEVWNGTEWILQDSISAGDAIWDDFLVVLNISHIQGNELQVRLKSTTGHYQINYVGIDYSEDEPMVIHKIKPYYAIKNEDENVLGTLKKSDENYEKLIPNDIIELKYKAIPKSEWKRDYTIAIKGYYNFIDFQDQTYSGFLEGTELWMKALTEPYFVAKTVFPYLQENFE